jgi:hypothetical protein
MTNRAIGVVACLHEAAAVSFDLGMNVSCARCRRRLRRAGAVTLFALCSSTRARAEPPAQLTIVGAGSCPTVADVASELRRIFPTSDVTTALEPGAPNDVMLKEQSGGVTVDWSGSQRIFDDPGRRCPERARQIAVIVALMLDPLRLPAVPPQAVPPVPAPVPVPVPLPPPAAPARVALAVGPSLYLAPGQAGVPLAGGAGARLIWGRDLSLSVGAALLSPATLHYAEADARELMLPLDAGVRFTQSVSHWEFGGEASLAAAPAYFRGQALSRSEAGFRCELGARLAVLASLWLTERVGLFASEGALFWPRPIALTVSRVGEVGHTPNAWLGTELGLVLKLY